MSNPNCPIKLPAVPYLIEYGCGYVNVTDNSGLTHVFTEIIKYDAVSVTLANSTFSGTYDIASSGLVVNDIITALQCTDNPRIDPELVCISNDGGATVLKGVIEFDISTTPFTSILYFMDGTLATGYEVVPCTTTLYDYEKNSVCYDGKSYTKWFVWDKQGDGLPNLIGIVWLDENDAVIPAPDPTLINNANCIPACLPTVASALGNDLSTLLPATSFSVIKPSCCIVTLVTSVGTIIIPGNVGAYSSSEFNCPIDILSITATCDLSKISIITNFKG